jgi:hypothetical protein
MADLPPDVVSQLARIRDRQLDNISKSLPELYGPAKVRRRVKGKWVEGSWKGLREEVGAAVDRMRAAGLDRKTVEAETKALSSGHYQRVRTVLVRQIQEASQLADRTQDLMDYYHATERFRKVGEAAGTAAELFTPRELQFLTTTESLGSAESATTWALKRRQKVVQPEAQILRQHKVPVSGRGNLALSEYLHGKAAADSNTLGRIVERGIREGQNLDETSRVMIDMIKREGSEVAGNKRLPKLLEELKSAGRELADGGGPKAAKKWEATQVRLDSYMGRLRRGGRVHSGYLEVLQDVRRRGPAAVDKALQKWMYQFQKYSGERIINTETFAAGRLRQFEAEKRRPWIKEYRWVMNPTVHGQYARRVKKPKSGKSKGIRCPCEPLDGQIVTRKFVMDRPHGLHPH